MNAPDSQTAGASLLFEAFLDPVDMVGCFAADTSIDQVNQAAAEHGLHFPLYCDPARTLREHFAAMEFTPASSRFGAYVDNVCGMNWKLPGGQFARIGERVIKSTTGYDLLRYLLHTGERYGRARDYVIRLRPKTEANYAGTFTGSGPALSAVISDVLRSSWSHWIDCFDWVSDSQSQHIELRGDCLPGEETLFLNYFKLVAETSGATFVESDATAPIPLPTFTINTVPSACREVAASCLNELGGSARVLLSNGIVLLYPQKSPSRALIELMDETAAKVGGHVFGDSLHETPMSSREQVWVETMLSEWVQI